jgi:predicted PurR-regulated permease PerM
MTAPEPPLRVKGPNGRTAGFIALAVAVVVAVFLVVRLADLILLVFASVLLAMLLLAIAGPLQKRLRMSRTAAVATVLVALSALGGALLWLLGAQIADQLSSLTLLLPRSWHALEGYLGQSPLGRLALDQIRSAKWPDNLILNWATRFAANLMTVVAASVIVLAGAIYLAFHPGTYRGGLLKLVPQPHRARADQVLEACRRALTQWLVGQSISMCFVALTTSIGLWLAGVRSPLALGLLAGVGHMVPVVGPWVTAAPGLLVAAAQSPETFGVALLVYLATSQVESNLLTPLLLRRMSEVPMAVTLFAVVAMGTLLGPLGILLATPLAVLAYVLLRTVYLEDVLGEPSSSISS